jgi:transcriptional regulator with XRE-family HTH domain
VSSREVRYRRFLIRLRKARIDAGMTQVEVAEVLGKPQSYVSKVETGERYLDVIEAMDLARACKKSLGHLLRGL